MKKTKEVALCMLPIFALGIHAVAQTNNVKSPIQKEYEKEFGIFEPNSAKKLTGYNVLLITSDQQHWMCMGYNDPNIKTPNLDRLAKRGLIFNREYTVNPTSTPTRATLLTGQMPSQHGAYALGTKLPDNVRTIAQDFQENGYETSLIGKAHFQPLAGNAEFPSIEAYPVLQDLDFWGKFTGPFYGFEHVELTRNHGDEAHVGQHYVLWMEEKLRNEGKDSKEWRKWFRKPTGLAHAQYGEWQMPERYHMNAWIAERSSKILEQYAREGKNFFMWASFFDPHPPYLVPSPWDTMYDPAKMNVPQLVKGEMDDMPPLYQKTQEKKPDFSEFKDSTMWSPGLNSHIKRTEAQKAKDMALYYGMISMMDHYIGVILDKLDELGLTDKTIVVFTTDHGNLFGQHGLIEKGPFLYEDLVKVPMIASCPGLIKQGVRTDALQSALDIPPTLLSLSGIKIPKIMTGNDQSKVWKGELDSIRDFVIIENHQEPYALYQKQLVTDRYKITTYKNHDYGELFDLKNDPKELNNLWDNSKYSEIKLKLLLKLIQSEMKQETVLMKRLSPA